ncbi:unnamed protein product [Cuscuta campestris]|uniref:J domain-containing protein n=2 Tax=Cuscuta sect. Cleistogrammica TaxID=1824901 RepID=A0A484MXJ2_9ASTE|nr:hypothetical protein DM860_016280 [Cuscuta australis]VFQ93573.1 unnamed protein product [Cuscuta campestris]
MGSRNRAQHYITAAESALAAQNFEECCKQAALAQESDPTNQAPAQLIAIADVMSAFSSTISSAADGSGKKSDYYFVLGVPRFTEDLDAIQSSFDRLSALLNPNTNPFHLCHQALALVRKAWKTLSNPNQKSKFDEELRTKLKSLDGSENQTFWTACTHCYCLYEYPAEYENCCLRCQNLSCQCVFTAAVCPPPPPEVIEKGSYDCLDGMSVVKTKHKMAANCSKKLMGKGTRVVQANGSAPL